LTIFFSDNLHKKCKNLNEFENYEEKVIKLFLPFFKENLITDARWILSFLPKKVAHAFTLAYIGHYFTLIMMLSGKNGEILYYLLD